MQHHEGDEDSGTKSYGSDEVLIQKQLALKTSRQQNNFRPVKKGKKTFQILTTGILRLKFIISQFCFST